MPLWPFKRSAAAALPAPRAAMQSADGGTMITTSDELDRFMRGEGSASKAGPIVNAESSLQDPVVFACVRIICGAVATMPLDIKRRIDDRIRQDATDTRLYQLIRRRPNSFQKPAQFRRMLQAHVLLRGQAFCLIVRSRGEVIALLPLMPDRMKVTQNADLSLNYEYRRKDGGLTVFGQSEIFHLFGLTLDGINGVTPITYARETIGFALAQRDQGASAFRHAARVGGVLEHPQKLGDDARKNLKSSLDEYRAGGESEGKWLILEEGMKPSELQMTAEDAQWIESRKFSRGDIAMLFGVPPHMIGDTEKSTSWGSGIYEQKDGFVTFTLDDHLTMWEETVTVDLAPAPDIYARFNRSALVKGNLNDRWNAHVKKLQWGVYSPNEIRAQEDDNPRDGGDIYYPPPNTAGGDPPADPSKQGA